MDVVIKNVPEGCEEEVKRMAGVAVERFLRQQMVVPREVVEQVTASIKAFKDANKEEVASGLNEAVE
jgi:hypothetical protein